MSCNTTEMANAPVNEMASSSRHPQPRILVVDDEPNVLMTIGALLAKAGFEVRKTTQGDEALRMIADDPAIEIVVTDFSMPEMSGARLISDAIRIRPNIKALMMTGYPNSDGLAELPRDTPVIAEPFRRAELIAEIKALLGKMPETRITNRASSTKALS